MLAEVNSKKKDQGIPQRSGGIFGFVRATRLRQIGRFNFENWGLNQLQITCNTCRQPPNSTRKGGVNTTTT